MNATKRKLDAILQRIGTRSSAAVSTDGFDIESGSRGPDSSGHLSSSTTTTTGDMAFDSELLAKRRRLLHATTGTTATAAASGPTTISNVVLRKWNPDGGVSTSSFKRPAGSSAASTRSSTPTPGSGAASSHRYSPTDRSALISRLATFQELTDWTPKPDRIGELAWARRGWVCVGKERVRCTLCGREVVVRLAGSSIKDKARGDEEKENGGGGSADGGEKESAASTPRKTILAGPAEITDALVDKFEEFIVTGHGEDCLWRKRGCDEHLLRLPMTNARASLQDLRQRYDELCSRQEFLPAESKLKLPPSLDLDAVIGYLPLDFFRSPAPSSASTTDTASSRPPPSQTKAPEAPQPPNRVALALALLGWQGYTNPRIGSVPNSASCHTCLRRLGLWMFKRVESATGATGSPSRVRAAPMSHLDPLREHRWFCPWKNGAVQHSGPGSGTSGTGVTTGTAVTQGPETSSERAAWEVLVAVLKGDAYLRGLEHQHRRHGRTKSSVQQSSGPSSTSSTVNAAGSLDAAATEGGGTPGTQPPEYRFDEVAADDDAAARELRDKERWARLRKVKSLFDTKGGRKIMRKNGSSSRPGTSGTLAPPSGGPTEPGTPASTVPDTPRTLGGGE